MGQLKIISDGTLAGTKFKDIETGKEISEVLSWSLGTAVDANGVAVLVAQIVVVPVISLDHVTTSIIPKTVTVAEHKPDADAPRPPKPSGIDR